MCRGQSEHAWPAGRQPLRPRWRGPDPPPPPDSPLTSGRASHSCTHGGYRREQGRFVKMQTTASRAAAAPVMEPMHARSSKHITSCGGVLRAPQRRQAMHPPSSPSPRTHR